jgi:hypothetical protein
MDRFTHDGAFDARHINLRDAQETPYWCALFWVTEAHLTSAVEAVGHRAQDVKNYLEREGLLKTARDAEEMLP